MTLRHPAGGVPSGATINPLTAVGLPSYPVDL
jgi:hypothetical protein